MAHTLFIPCQSASPFLRWGYFRLTLKLLVKVMGVVKGQAHSQTSILLIRFFFNSHQTKTFWWLFRNFTLKHPRSMSWMRLRSHIIFIIQPMYYFFVSRQSEQAFLRYGQIIVWPWKKHIWNFDIQIAEITVSNRTFWVITLTRAIKPPRFVSIRRVVLTLSSRQANFR